MLRALRSVDTLGTQGNECYEYVLREAQKLSWSPASSGKQRLLVMIGDANPHPLGSNNPHAIDWRSEARNLAARGVRVHAVHALGRPHSRAFYQELAATTGGHYLRLDQFSSIRDLILSVAYAARRDSAEDFSRLKSRRCTAVDWNFIPAYCFAIS